MESDNADPRLGLAWPINSYTGWGLLGTNLAIELVRTCHRRPVFLGSQPRLGNRLELPLLRATLAESRRIRNLVQPDKKLRTRFPIFHSLGTDLLRTPTGEPFIGEGDFGIIFCENTNISRRGIERGRQYRAIAAGSSWCRDLLLGVGLKDVFAWRQGVDISRFHPAPARGLFPGRFVIFSGGTVQFRKAQDIVVAAYRIFRERHPEALLVTAWDNHHLSYAATLLASKLLRASPIVGDPQRLDLDRWLVEEGLPKYSFLNLPKLPNAQIPELLREAHVALFPNRCEAGTNLVAMEAIASGLPCIIADSTGQRDLVSRFPCRKLSHRPLKALRDRPQLGVEGWGDPDVEEVVEALEAIYTDYVTAKNAALTAARLMREWTWEKTTPELLAGFGLSSAARDPRQSTAQADRAAV